MMDVQLQVQRVPCPPEWEGTWRVTAMRLWEMLEKSASSDEHVQDCTEPGEVRQDQLITCGATPRRTPSAGWNGEPESVTGAMQNPQAAPEGLLLGGWGNQHTYSSTKVP